MNYRFILTYKPTDSETTSTRVCFPLHNNDLAVSIDREEGEWYYTRSLEGNLIFVGGDYSWIMALPFDGTFTINIQQSTDGTTYYDYFTGTFSRASLEIDEDNHRVTLSSLKEGITDLVKNGAKEEYDLMKLIPDSYAKEVQGQVPPALALVDFRSSNITFSDIFCKTHFVSSGFKEDSGWTEYCNVNSNSFFKLMGIYAEAKVEMRNGVTSELAGSYTGQLNFEFNLNPDNPLLHLTSPQTPPNRPMRNKNGCCLEFLSITTTANEIICRINLLDRNWQYVTGAIISAGWNETNYYSPAQVTFDDFGSTSVQKVTVIFHYICASLLTADVLGNQVVRIQRTPTNWETWKPLLLSYAAGGWPMFLLTGEVESNYTNVELPLYNQLDMDEYYRGMSAFEGSGLQIEITSRTVDQPNGHRLVPGTDDISSLPQYFAPPDTEHDWIPLAEDNWNYASIWYTIQPSVTNGLDDPAKIGTFRWTRCWTIGTCIQFLLHRITDGKVVFAESTDYSQFLYGNPNPVEGHEPFQWLVTQKSNVMRPSTGGAGAARCIVRLDWFLELLRNAFNCYYWFEKVNGGTYNLRIEHVEYFRRGGTYTPNTDDPPLDLTRLKPYRNFLRNGQPAKRYADQTNKYTFDLDGMVEKYTYSWQGEGGGDDFRGNPMFFKAGWIEKGKSEDHQVDNIFADLGWLMLNAGTDTASSKNYDGLFIFGGYNPYTAIEWTENSHPASQTLTIATATIRPRHIEVYITLTVPEGQQITVYTLGSHVYSGTGKPMTITINNILSTGSFYIDFGANYAQVTLHRIAFPTGYSNVYRIPNVDNKLRENTYLQNGVLAWPWLQKEYLHYDIPASKWTYLKDDYTDNPNLVWESDGTIKMVKKQSVGVVPVPDASTEEAIMDIMGIKTGLGIGIIDSAKINLSSRNAEMTIIYDINPQNQ